LLFPRPLPPQPLFPRTLMESFKYLSHARADRRRRDEPVRAEARDDPHSGRLDGGDDTRIKAERYVLPPALFDQAPDDVIGAAGLAHALGDTRQRGRERRLEPGIDAGPAPTEDEVMGRQKAGEVRQDGRIELVEHGARHDENAAGRSRIA